MSINQLSDTVKRTYINPNIGNITASSLTTPTATITALTATTATIPTLTSTTISASSSITAPQITASTQLTTPTGLIGDIAITNKSLSVGIGEIKIGNEIQMYDNPIALRSDVNHRLVFGGDGHFDGATINGPILHGYSAGCLGIRQDGFQRRLLEWNQQGVTFNTSLIYGTRSIGTPKGASTFGTTLSVDGRLLWAQVDGSQASSDPLSVPMQSGGFSGYTKSGTGDWILTYDNNLFNSNTNAVVTATAVYDGTTDVRSLKASIGPGGSIKIRCVDETKTPQDCTFNVIVMGAISSL